MKTGIALLPHVLQLQRLIELQAAALDLVQLRPRLGETSYQPHVTLLQGESDEPLCTAAELDAVGRAVLQSMPPLTATTAGLEYVESGWYFLKLSKPPVLQALHDAFFHLCRERLRPPCHDVDVSDGPGSYLLRGFTQSQIANYLSYGYRYIGSDFNPHFTIGRTVDRRETHATNELQVLAEHLGVKEFTFAVLTVYEMGENGGHLRTIHQVQLGSG